MLEGIFVALVTPFKNENVDEDKLRELIRFQLQNDIDGILVCGTTGESPALTAQEKKRMIEILVAEAKGKTTVIAGTGTNNTQKSIAATREAKELGADAALVITPYYNKPTQEGLYRHFKAVAEAVDIPIIIYNVPGRTGVNILPDTVARLAKFKNIVSIKEASGIIGQTTEYRRACGDEFSILSGEDPIFAPSLVAGADGIISVTANIVPGDLKKLYKAYKKGDFKTVEAMHKKMYPLNTGLFFESNPIPVKAALNMIGKNVGEPRLPLAPMSEANKEKLRHVLVEYGLL